MNILPLGHPTSMVSSYSISNSVIDPVFQHRDLGVLLTDKIFWT